MKHIEILERVKIFIKNIKKCYGYYSSNINTIDSI